MHSKSKTICESKTICGPDWGPRGLDVVLRSPVRSPCYSTTNICDLCLCGKLQSLSLLFNSIDSWMFCFAVRKTRHVQKLNLWIARQKTTWQVMQTRINIIVQSYGEALCGKNIWRMKKFYYRLVCILVLYKLETYWIKNYFSSYNSVYGMPSSFWGLSVDNMPMIFMHVWLLLSCTTITNFCR